MEMTRAVIHMDADAFFASVEQAADPRLRGKPIAVGGDKRGIIASASYEARRYGIYTPMPTSRARKLCPSLILLPGDFEKYEQFSRWMFSYIYDFTPMVEVQSIDEGYFEVTGCREPARAVAERVRRVIGEGLKISVSEGIGTNKLVSQIASKLRKPRALLQVPAGEEQGFLHPLANRWLPGVGPHTAGRMNAAGLTRIGQIAATPVDCLALLVGRSAPTLRAFANGIDERPVEPAETPAQSYGKQHTFAEDTIDEHRVEITLRGMADSLMAAVRREGKLVRTLTVKVRYNDMGEHQCGESLQEPTDLEEDLYGRILPLLRRAWHRRVSLRMAALRLSDVYRSYSRAELPLFGAAHAYPARRALAEAVHELQQRYGPTAAMRGHQWELHRTG